MQQSIDLLNIESLSYSSSGYLKSIFPLSDYYKCASDINYFFKNYISKRDYRREDKIVSDMAESYFKLLNSNKNCIIILNDINIDRLKITWFLWNFIFKLDSGNSKLVSATAESSYGFSKYLIGVIKSIQSKLEIKYRAEKLQYGEFSDHVIYSVTSGLSSNKICLASQDADIAGYPSHQVYIESINRILDINSMINHFTYTSKVNKMILETDVEFVDLNHNMFIKLLNHAKDDSIADKQWEFYEFKNN